MNKLSEALRNAGIPFPKQSTESLRIVRWGHNKRYWIRKFEGGYVFGDFVTGLSSHVFDKEYTGAKLREVQQKMNVLLLKLEEELQLSYRKCSKLAQSIWDESYVLENNICIPTREPTHELPSENGKQLMTSQGLTLDSAEPCLDSHDFSKNITKNGLHPYLLRKKVGSHGIREYKGNLVVPAYDQDGKLWTLQFISANGEKRFLAGGRKKGCFFTIGLLDNAAKIFICEGYATGATIYECTDKKPVVVAFDANGLKSVSHSHK